MTTTTDRGFTIVRRFEAPRDDVFRAWTDPALLGWFADTGVPGERNPTTVDLRVGGAWRVHMIDNEDRDYTTGGVYREIVPPERLVFAWGTADGWPRLDPERPDDSPIATVTLAEVDGGTEMTFHLGFADALSDEAVRHWLSLGVEDGWGATLDRLTPILSPNGVS